MTIWNNNKYEKEQYLLGLFNYQRYIKKIRGDITTKPKKLNQIKIMINMIIMKEINHNKLY